MIELKNKKFELKIKNIYLLKAYNHNHNKMRKREKIVPIADMVDTYTDIYLDIMILQMKIRDLKLSQKEINTLYEKLALKIDSFNKLKQFIKNNVSKNIKKNFKKSKNYENKLSH